MKLSFLSRLVLAVACIAPANATILDSCNFDNITIAAAAPWDMTDNNGGKLWRWNASSGTYGVERPFASGVTPSGTGKSLKLRALRTNVAGKQPAQRDEYYTRFGRTEPFGAHRWMEMDLYINTDTTLPSGSGSILSQWHQNWNNTVVNTSPFGQLVLVKVGGQFTLQMRVLNSDHYGASVNGGPWSVVGGGWQVVWSRTVSLGAWYNLCIGVSPNPAGGGNVQVFLNGASQANWTGKVGFPSNFLGGSFQTVYTHKFGVYRYDTSWLQTIYIDNYKWATSQSGGHAN
jgi:hypothetical protein